MKYIIGIDSGGTKYLVKICDLQGNEIGEHVGIPAAHYHYPREEVIKRINKNIDDCLNKIGGRREDCVYLVCGTTGLDSQKDEILIKEIYDGLDGFTCPVICVNDAEVAHFAATGGKGALVISGTGSIAFGRNSQGKITRSGGWPPCIFGDDGSGTWISYKALYHLTLWFDERVPASPLSEMLIETLKYERREDLIRTCIEIESKKWKNPGLAYIVDKAGAQGDKYAIDIIKEAAKHTFDLADSIIKKLELNKEKTFKVGVWGSAIVKSPLHLKYFKENLYSKYKNAQVIVSDIDAAMGACKMALEKIQTGN